MRVVALNWFLITMTDKLIYRISETNNQDRLFSEYYTSCIWEACAELLLKCRVKSAERVMPELNIRSNYQILIDGILFISLRYTFDEMRKVILKLETMTKPITHTGWTKKSTNELYLSVSYKQTHAVLTERLKVFLNERETFLVPLISCCTKDVDHIFWSKKTDKLWKRDYSF